MDVYWCCRSFLFALASYNSPRFLSSSVKDSRLKSLSFSMVRLYMKDDSGISTTWPRGSSCRTRSLRCLNHLSCTDEPLRSSTILAYCPLQRRTRSVGNYMRQEQKEKTCSTSIGPLMTI